MPAASPVLQGKDVQSLPLESLTFDPDNPRFAALARSERVDVSAVIERMTQEENVQELMGSIGKLGYFPGEPLLVAPNPQGPGYIVVEGNRRLAALKLLTGQLPSDLPSVQTLRGELSYGATHVPCLVFDNRNELLRYLGYRHITGAKRWEPLPKARFLQQLRDTFFTDLDADDQLRAIAREIGSKPSYVGQLLTGIAVFDRATERGFFGLPNVSADTVEFSLLTTALSYSNIAEYVGLNGRIDTLAPDLKEPQCKNLFLWMFSRNEDGETVLGESRNLRKLAAVVAKPRALEVLGERRDLEHAFLFSDGPAAAFEVMLTQVEGGLAAALTLAYDVPVLNAGHSHHAERLMNMAEDLASTVRKEIRRQRSADEHNA